ncbi:DMT family transporter [Niveibacterium sp. SC-1]|uniref:DMT family transporter n=1 Tax=Niveibacterium sp. SC-1 TaxID=3135646 RepID=UPI00311F236A
MSVASSAPPRDLGPAYLWGMLGVLGFALTLPMTRIAVRELDPLLVGPGRAVPAALICGLLMWRDSAPRPRPGQWLRLALVSVGIVLGFPLCSAYALQQMPASHGAVLISLIPLFTALGGCIRAGERPRAAFWLCSVAAVGIVFAHAMRGPGGSLSQADAVLLLGVLCCAAGYTEGALLSRELGAWRVICWSLLLGAPLIAPFTLRALPSTGVSTGAWLAFFYVSLVSALLAFCAWYRGLALGGIGRIAQLQLLQPFITLLVASALLGEILDPGMLVAAAAVSACIALGRRRAAPASGHDEETVAARQA